MWNNPNIFNANLYRDSRPDYSIEFLSSIKLYLNNHLNSKIPFDEKTSIAFNIGCGPGKACLGLKKLFSKVFASDPSNLQISAAPKIEGVEYDILAADELLQKYPPHQADICFFGLSLQFVGVSKGVMCSKYLLKRDSPSIMCAMGYHLGYICDPTGLPKDSLDYFSRFENNLPNNCNSNDIPTIYEDITEWYPDHMNSSLFNKNHYPHHIEASQHINKLNSFIKKGEPFISHSQEFSNEIFDYTYTKKIYFHTIEKTNLKRILKHISSWEGSVNSHMLNEFITYKENFSMYMQETLNLTTDTDPIYLGRIYYTILCSDNINL